MLYSCYLSWCCRSMLCVGQLNCLLGKLITLFDNLIRAVFYCARNVFRMTRQFGDRDKCTIIGCVLCFVFCLFWSPRQTQKHTHITKIHTRTHPNYRYVLRYPYAWFNMIQYILGTPKYTELDSCTFNSFRNICSAPRANVSDPICHTTRAQRRADSRIGYAELCSVLAVDCGSIREVGRVTIRQIGNSSPNWNFDRKRADAGMPSGLCISRTRTRSAQSREIDGEAACNETTDATTTAPVSRSHVNTRATRTHAERGNFVHIVHAPAHTHHARRAASMFGGNRTAASLWSSSSRACSCTHHAHKNE